MTMDALAHFSPVRPRLIAVDSDGCVLDSMEVKQRRCFIPATLDVWGLGEVEASVWEAAVFVNLYSRWRGTNRFVALAKTFELLSRRREVRERGVGLPDVAVLRRWLAGEASPSDRTLARSTGVPPVARLAEDSKHVTADAHITGHRLPGGTLHGRDAHATHGRDARATGCGRDVRATVLATVLEWSREVDRRVERLAAGDVLPFSAVGASLAALSAVADVVVVSAAPVAALAREWSRCGLAGHVRWMAGQESGGKAALLRALAARYAPGRAMMVGDAPADLEAARGAGMLFFPICPGDEDASWRRLVPAGLERFLDGDFAGPFEESLVAEFLNGLPEVPPWEENFPERT